MATTNNWLKDYLNQQLEETNVEYTQHILNVKQIRNPFYMVKDNQTEMIWSDEDEDTYTKLELRRFWLLEQIKGLEVSEEDQRRIDSLRELIDSYEDQYDSIKEEIEDYQNNYDYESDPEGIDYDLHFVHQLTIDAESVQKTIDSLYEELNQI